MNSTNGWLVCVAIFTFAALGCGGSNESAHAKQHARGADQVASASKAHDHSGWWCDEHGIPEGICAQCNTKVAEEFKNKGDWCAQHDRPDSQCFVCHPELEAKFAAQYELKYGKKPPKREPEPTAR
jgi:cobalt-zinc-cadmium efflux system membrane fusion protein